MSEFSHMDEKGRARMVDVGGKGVTGRRAVARSRVFMRADTFEKVSKNRSRKGNVLETARIAGIMAAKQTHLLIPMCHPIQIRHVQIDFYPDAESGSFRIEAAAEAEDRTGVEMEAMTAASVAALTIYDMCKSHDREMVISDVCLLEKSGGKSGHYVRNPDLQDPGA
ncbi:MAG: cyclic pyranopterin monophosphate synthase MoaC [Desulfobacterales bacterium]|nr:cyclic pyranopterin monophosphate synthase MoaC [Desulfobacterales bacterium]